MEPTLPNGSWVLVNRRAYSGGRVPERFDIVRMEDPATPRHWIIKRIVGLPDEEVALIDGRLYVDDRIIEEKYLRGITGPSPKHEWWPRAGEYVVIGDNRDASTDSRKFGPVPITGFRGRVVRRLR